jgi:adenylate cyclase
MGAKGIDLLIAGPRRYSRPMDPSAIDEISAWLADQGLAGAQETQLLGEFCERCCAVGLKLARALTFIDTLHPVYEGRAFRWRAGGMEQPTFVEYGRTDAGEAAENWRRTPFFYLLESGESELRRRLGTGEPADFNMIEEVKKDGCTDYIAFVHRFPGEGAIGEMDCFYSAWSTRAPQGFKDEDIAALRRLLPTLALAIKCGSLGRIAGTLVQVYLGRDPGQRVLSGRIARGVADRISAVLWFSDLRGFTTITDGAAPDEVIPLLNDYAEAVISAIYECGGDVLKLIGDGALAIFPAEDSAAACRAALAAETNLRRRERELNERRRNEGRPVTNVYLGLHIGDVFYGNVGSDDRLDFTVVGPAVNEVARIAALCRSVDRPVVMSADFAQATPDPERGTIVSVGRYALRGVGRAQELFTLDPERGF